MFMEKINLGPKGFVYPMPVSLVGATVNGLPNFMTVGWVNRANSNPPLVVAALNKNHYTSEGIKISKSFSINFPSAEMVVEADYCGLVSGRKTDKSEIFTMFYGELETAPMIQECPLSLECRLFGIHELPTNNLFIGEIIATYSEEKFLTDGKPDIKKMNPLVLTMPDNQYWSVGKMVGKAWNIGKKLRQEKIV